MYKPNCFEYYKQKILSLSLAMRSRFCTEEWAGLEYQLWMAVSIDTSQKGIRSLCNWPRDSVYCSKHIRLVWGIWDKGLGSIFTAGVCVFQCLCFVIGDITSHSPWCQSGLVPIVCCQTPWHATNPASTYGSLEVVATYFWCFPLGLGMKPYISWPVKQTFLFFLWKWKLHLFWKRFTMVP